MGLGPIVSLGQVVEAQPVIPNGQATSSTITTNNLALCGVSIPAAFTGTQITFLVATNDNPNTFQPLYNGAGQVKYTVAPNYYVGIDPKDFYGAAFIQIVSNANEAAQRTLVAVLKGI